MARHKNTSWNLPEGQPNGHGSTVHSWESIHASLLMDIRDELQALNRILGCPNFLGVPWTLKGIEANTKRRKKKPVVKRRRAA